MKLELTEEEMNQCIQGGVAATGSGLRAMIQMALDMASAKIPEPPRWIPIAERRPSPEDGPVVYGWSPVLAEAYAIESYHPELKPGGAFTYWLHVQQLPEFPSNEPAKI